MRRVDGAQLRGEGRKRGVAEVRDEAASEAQLRNIRAHLQRTRTEEAALCARAGVAALEELTRGAAADLLKELSRQPNAA